MRAAGRRRSRRSRSSREGGSNPPASARSTASTHRGAEEANSEEAQKSAHQIASRRAAAVDAVVQRAKRLADGAAAALLSPPRADSFIIASALWDKEHVPFKPFEAGVEKMLAAAVPNFPPPLNPDVEAMLEAVKPLRPLEPEVEGIQVPALECRAQDVLARKKARNGE